MKLTNIAIKNAKPQDKPYHLMDGDNLSLLITPMGKFPPVSVRKIIYI